MNAPTIRKATIDDLPALTKLAEASWHASNADALPEKTLEALTDNHSLAGLMASRWSEIWLAETTGDLSGIGAADETGHIWLMYVDPSCQGTGVGTALLDHLTGQMPSALPAASLDVMDGNTEALAFYLSRGWTEETRREVELPGTTATAIRLTKSLP